MTLALIYGAGAGALHAVTGPDHVLSLGPVALGNPKQSFRVGLRWGVGHALGTLLLALPAVFLARWFDLAAFAAHGGRLAGAALMATAALSWLALRRRGAAAVEARSPLWVGVIHGVTGAASLLVVLPVLVLGSNALTLTFLLAFSVGSALAMAALTSAIARLGAKLRPATVALAQRVSCAVALGVGGVWLSFG